MSLKEVTHVYPRNAVILTIFSVKWQFFENFESLCENCEANFDFFLKKISETKLYISNVFFRVLLIFLEKKTMHQCQFSICHSRNFSILTRGVIQKSIFGYGKLDFYFQDFLHLSSRFYISSFIYFQPFKNFLLNFFVS